jgi:hypothetical protein
MTDYMQRLLERLQTGWRPKRDEIDMRIPQHDPRYYWDFLDPNPGGHRVMLHYYGRELSGDILWIDAKLEFALCEDGFWWL